MPDNFRKATLRHCVAEVARRLAEANLWFGHGTDNAWDEALWLVMCAAEIPISEKVVDWQQALSTAQGCAVTKLANERITSRQPLAYLVGHAWFAGYVPARRPRVAFVVVLEHAGSGGRKAGPVARALVESLQVTGLIAPPSTAAATTRSQNSLP